MYRDTIFHDLIKAHRRKVKLTDKYTVKRCNDLMQAENASGGRPVSAGIE